MAPKKPTVTSSSTRSARVKGGSNPVVTQGAARNRAARATLGPTPKQRPMATGGTKGPLQGGTRSPSLKMNPTKMEAGPGKVGPNLGQQTTTSSAGRRGPRPPSENRIRSMEAGPAKVTGNQGQQSTASSAGRRGPRPAPQAPKPAWGPVPTATEARNARNAANRAAKGYGQPGKVEAGLRQAAGMGMTAARIARGVTPAGVAYETLKARPTAAGTLPPGKFANARDLAFAKAKGIKGSPVLGGKKSVAASFDSAFAAARKAGKATFTHKGKKYNTKMA